MSGPTGDSSYFVGVTQYGRMFNKSRWWGRTRFEEWLVEQEKGGPKRIWVEGKKLYTTIGVIQRENPNVRDPLVMRKLKEHDTDLDVHARQITFLTEQVRILFKMLEPKSGSRLRTG